MKFVVKLGGAALENPALLANCARSIAELARDGHRVAVVHGGGVQLTRLLALVFLTDVPGVKGADGNVLRWLSLKDVPALERQSVISGGMLPKLNACKEALTHGVTRVRILPAESASVLPDFTNTRIDDGTEVIAA